MTLEVPDVVERPREIPPVDAKPAWGPAFKRAVAKFSLDQITDSAAMLTYYAVFSLFPALAAVVSLISMVVSPDTIISILSDITGKPASDLSTVEDTVNRFAESSGAGLTLVIGVLAGLWSAAGYVGGFSRVMNKIYGVEEGRPIWVLRPWLYLVTIIQALLIVLIILSFALSGSVAKSIFSEIGLGDEAAGVWDMAKLPFMALIVVLIIGLLYWATPNVRKPKRLFISWGALFALVAWILATIAFALYVGLSAGAKYQETFGPFATAALFIFWLWLTNVVILFGAELDAELERTRQLKSGLPAETMLLFPLRDDAEIDKKQNKLDHAIADSYALQEEAEETLDERGMPLVGRQVNPAVERAAEADAVEAAEERSPQDPTAEVVLGTTALRDGDATARGRARREQILAETKRDRARRRSVELARMRKARVDRERLERQERKAARIAAEAEKRQRKLEAGQTVEPVPLQEQWAEIDRVRARYAPRDSVLRDDVMAERTGRRAAFNAEQAEKAANPPPPKPPKPAKVPMPSPLRDEVTQERRQRRSDWYSEHEREKEDVPLPKRRDLKQG